MCCSIRRCSRGKNANLDLNNVTLDEALDYIALLTKTFWKPVSANAIFVTEDNVTKRRDYEDEVVKVFYLKNPTSVQEFQEIVTAVRSVSDVRRMFTFNAQNAVVVRDTVDKVALVEKLLHDMDKPKAEVVVDMIVMEVISDRQPEHRGRPGVQRHQWAGDSLRVLRRAIRSRLNERGDRHGRHWSTTPTGTTSGTTNTGGARSRCRNWGIIRAAAIFPPRLPGAMLQAVMSDSAEPRCMQSPEVRASDGQKVTLKIGDRSSVRHRQFPARRRNRRASARW